MLNSVIPWLLMASTSAQPKNTPISRPRIVPCRAMITDSQRIIARSWCLVIPTARSIPSSRVRSKIVSTSVLMMPRTAMTTARPIQADGRRWLTTIHRQNARAPAKPDRF